MMNDSRIASSRLDFDIVHRPDFAVLQVRLRPGEQVFGEPTAMMAMDPHIQLKAVLRGGLMQSFGRALGGESMFVNTFTATDRGGEVLFAPGPMGDLVHYRLQGNNVMLQRGAFVAHGSGVTVTGKWEGVRGFFSGAGFILLRASGTGDLFFNTYGAIIEIDVRGSYFVDTGYVVAFEDTLGYQVTTLPGLGIANRMKTFLFGGEGLVCQFKGEGKLWIQTRAINPFLTFLHPFRRVAKKPTENNDS